ncbi:hypothetical protein AK830_g4588 [Neonectria ditissima]|uniref:Uncharacterized protein n=1 Tax=Neonectria ditissima TaxID=78410 RepID=A0A0P7BMT4_9HYPO|nr:hypothetical protein AK830_g4588 [Neonectria ditissima]
MTAPLWLSHYKIVLSVAEALAVDLIDDGDDTPKYGDFFVCINSTRCHRRKNEAGVSVRDCQGFDEYDMRQREQVLERIVMSEEYDSQSRGKQGKTCSNTGITARGARGAHVLGLQLDR